MSAIEKSFVPILDSLLVRRVDRCQREFDDELFACQYGINACVASFVTSHYIHADDTLGRACKLHCLKATHDFLAAFQLLRSSMHSQAANATRLGCETAWQNAALHEHPDLLDQWHHGFQIRPAKVRSLLRRFAGQRCFLYEELSRIAHPNEAAMVALQPWPAGEKEVDPDVLLPVYEPEQIGRTLRALFVAQYIAQVDFDANHIDHLTSEQRNAFSVQARSMAEYYARVVEPGLDPGLRGLTGQRK